MFPYTVCIRKGYWGNLGSLTQISYNIIKMKSIILFFIFLGIIMIIYNQKSMEKPPIIRYQYIPQNLYDYQLQSMPVLGIYGDLFQTNDSWMTSIGQNNFDQRKREVY
jgi:hypothetical protein